jgi:hypothetical protein
MANTKPRELKLNLNKSKENIQQEDKENGSTVIKSEAVKTKQQKDIRKVPTSSYVVVRANQYGGLKYINQRTGFSIEWDGFGSVQFVSLEELVNMRNTQRKFFEKNWIIIEGFSSEEFSGISSEEILDFLQIKQYYKAELCPDNIEDIFKLSPEEIEIRLPRMSNGIKQMVVLRANDLIENGKLDSIKVVRAIESALGCELIRA